MKAATFVPDPKAVVTETATGPAEPDGTWAVSWVALFRVIEVPVLEPNLTLMTVVKFVPVIVTDVPVSGPLAGVTAVTVGVPT